MQNHPNPFNPVTTIHYGLPQDVGGHCKMGRGWAFQNRPSQECRFSWMLLGAGDSAIPSFNTITGELARVGSLDDYVGLAVRDVTNIALADSVPTSIRDDSRTVPNDFVLEQNYPNPFNPSTTIRYSLSEASEIELSVFNIKGRKIKTLVKTRQQAGNYRAVFDADGLASGVYFYRLRAEHFVQTRKMLLLQ